MQAVEISRTDYEPSGMDILYADGITSSNSLTCMEFSFPKSAQYDSLDPFYQHDSSLRSVLPFFSLIISYMNKNALILIKIDQLGKNFFMTVLTIFLLKMWAMQF